MRVDGSASTDCLSNRANAGSFWFQWEVWCYLGLVFTSEGIVRYAERQVNFDTDNGHSDLGTVDLAYLQSRPTAIHIISDGLCNRDHIGYSAAGNIHAIGIWYARQIWFGRET